MTRRQFIKKFLMTLQSMLILNLMPKSPLSAFSDESGKEPLHYKPLNGSNLHDIAREKKHHSSKGFVNPLKCSSNRLVRGGSDEVEAFPG